MLPAIFRDTQARLALLRQGRKQAGEIGPGLVFSVLLHGFAALMVLFFLMRSTQAPPPPATRLVPVDVVRLGDRTAGPPDELKARVPLAKALPGPRQDESSPMKPQGVAPD